MKIRIKKRNKNKNSLTNFRQSDFNVVFYSKTAISRFPFRHRKKYKKFGEFLKLLKLENYVKSNCINSFLLKLVENNIFVKILDL